MMPPYVSLWQIYPTTIHDPKRLHVVLKAFYDGSNRQEVIVLAGLAANEATWESFEPAWGDVLANHGVSEFHATDAFGRPPKGEFEGWTDEQVTALFKDLIAVLNNHSLVFTRANRDSDPIPQLGDGYEARTLQGYACVVPIADYNRAKEQIKDLKPIEAICVDGCVGNLRILPEWERVALYFDRNEAFMKHIYRPFKWATSRKNWHKTPENNWAKRTEEILPVSSARRPIQGADLLGWIVGANHSRSDRFFEKSLTVVVTKPFVQTFTYDTIVHHYGPIPSQSWISSFGTAMMRLVRSARRFISSGTGGSRLFFFFLGFVFGFGMNR